MKKQIIFYVLIFLGLSFSACDFKQKEKNALEDAQSLNKPSDSLDIYEVSCERVGVIEKKDKELQLRMKFGESAVTRDSFFLEGMFQEMVTIVDKGKPSELQIHWDEHGRIAFIDIAREDSPYHLTNGIRIGTSLSKLAALNQKAISFYGFGWDYSGTLQGMNQGKLEESFPCFSGALACKDETYPSVLLGDQIITSDFPEANQVDIYLSTMRISFEKKSQ